MEGGSLIAIFHTESGWCLRQLEDELGYYSSLPEVMNVAYSKEWQTNNYGEVEQGNCSSDHGRSP